VCRSSEAATVHHKSHSKKTRMANNEVMKRRNREYWACQIAGWGGFSAVGLITGVMENGWRPSVVIGYIFFFLYSIGFTHLLRAEIHRRAWMSLPPLRALARLSVAGILIAAVQSGLVVGIYTAIEGKLGDWSEPSSIVYMFLWLAVIGNIWGILYFAITALRHSREVRRNETQMKLALSEAELRALEAQLNPHFLFNCLNSIRGMISEDPAQAQDMITRLANILRYNLQRDRQHTVPLSSEMEAVSDYLALESIRFENRLRVQMAVDEAVHEFPVPPMLLQTLVENGIKHGVEERASGSDLHVRAFLDGPALRIEVENTGHLNGRQPGSTQVGLANARERLRILYGERASLHLGPCGEERVAATLLIPSAS